MLHKREITLSKPLKIGDASTGVSTTCQVEVSELRVRVTDGEGKADNWSPLGPPRPQIHLEVGGSESYSPGTFLSLQEPCGGNAPPGQPLTLACATTGSRARPVRDAPESGPTWPWEVRCS